MIIKNLYLVGLIVWLSSATLIMAQSSIRINPKVQQGKILVTDHNKAELSFDFIMEDDDHDNQVISDQAPVRFSVCLMNAHIIEDIAAIQSSSPQFALRFNQDRTCIYATQQTELIGDKSYLLTLPVDINSVLELGSQQVGFLVNIQPAACMNSSNNPSDDKLFESRSKQHLKDQYVDLIQDLIEPIAIEDPIDIDILPNPTSTEYIGIYLSRPLNEAQVYLYDLTGKLLIDQYFTVLDHNKIELHGIPSGRYELVVQSHNLSKNLIKTVIIANL